MVVVPPVVHEISLVPLLISRPPEGAKDLLALVGGSYICLIPTGDRFRSVGREPGISCSEVSDPLQGTRKKFGLIGIRSLAAYQR